VHPENLPSPKDKIVVHKAGGEWQYFSSDKLFKFLKNVGLSSVECEFVLSELVRSLGKEINTREVTASVVAILRQLPKGARYAAIYTLKDSLRRMGPDGHNFEKFIGKLFEYSAYKVNVSQFVRGDCVEHEVDVVASNDTEINLVECKFHNTEGKRSDVVVAMYTHARFMDIEQADKRDDRKVIGWLATNTKLTIDALKYVQCKGMHLLSVENPHNDNIMTKVRDANLFPLASIDILEPYIATLMAADYVLAEDLLRLDSEGALELGIPTALLNSAQNQIKAVLQR